MQSGLLARVGGWLAWGLLPTIAVMELVDLRRGLDGRPAVISAYLIAFTLITLACLPWTLRRWREIDRPVRLALVVFVGLLVVAAISAATGPLPWVQRHVVIPREDLVVPVITAGLTLTAAVSFALIGERAQRRTVLWSTAWVVLACTLLNWPRAMLVHQSIRISTGMGGAAIYHVVLLTCGAIFLGAVVEGWRRRSSAVGLALTVLATLAVGSRAGLLTLVVFAVLVTAWGLRRGMGRWLIIAISAGAAAAALVMVVVPDFRRLLALSDERRATNMTNALAAWTQSPTTVVFGQGSGQVWPWYALDVQHVPAPGSNFLVTQFGKVLTSPHSTFLAVLVELGLVGMALFLVVLALLVVALVRSWRDDRSPGRTLVLLALVATLPAFLFDTYLLKNFGVSFWWWLMFTSAASGAFGPRSSTPAGSAGESADVSAQPGR